jgi:hypothetical protein
MLVFIDGSGDLGLTEKYIRNKSSSSHYCLGVIASKSSYQELEDHLRSSREKYEKVSSQRLPQELKYTKMSQSAREYFCTYLRKSDFERYVLILNKKDDKSKVSPWNKAEISEPTIQKELLSVLFEILLINPEYKLNTDEKIDIYFDDNLHTKYSKMLERQSRRVSNKVTIHKSQDSRTNIGIQLADLLAGSCFHYLNGEKKPFDTLIEKCKVSEISLQEGMGFYKLTHSKFIIK